MKSKAHLLIESNTKELAKLEEWLRHPGPEDQDRVAAISQYWHRYDQLALPGGLERGLALLAVGDAHTVESAVTFLEVNPLFHRSGYIKADLLRLLKRANLAEDLKKRLRKVLLARVEGTDSREFRHYARLAPAIADKSLRDALQINLESTNPVTARHAKWILQALDHATNKNSRHPDQIARSATYWKDLAALTERLRHEPHVTADAAGLHGHSGGARHPERSEGPLAFAFDSDSDSERYGASTRMPRDVLSLGPAGVDRVFQNKKPVEDVTRTLIPSKTANCESRSANSPPGTQQVIPKVKK